jgi:hypothetical protein
MAMGSMVRVGRLLLCISLTAITPGHTRADPKGEPWRDSFTVDTAALATVGESRYFILRPKYRLTLEGRAHGKPVRLVITVLDETHRVGDVETRVVEERETSGDTLLEISRNYYAIDARTGDVFYFGEDVDTYKHGKLAGHEGGWHHGSDRARFGLMMAGAPAVGSRYYQEQAPGVAMDRAEVVSLTDRIATPAGVFEACLKTKETSPLEPLVKGYKVYAPGVGLVKDGSLVLVSHDSSS